MSREGVEGERESRADSMLSLAECGAQCKALPHNAEVMIKIWSPNQELDA